MGDTTRIEVMPLDRVVKTSVDALYILNLYANGDTRFVFNDVAYKFNDDMSSVCRYEVKNFFTNPFIISDLSTARIHEYACMFSGYVFVEKEED